MMSGICKFCGCTEATPCQIPIAFAILRKRLSGGGQLATALSKRLRVEPNHRAQLPATSPPRKVWRAA